MSVSLVGLCVYVCMCIYVCVCWVAWLTETRRNGVLRETSFEERRE